MKRRVVVRLLILMVFAFLASQPCDAQIGFSFKPNFDFSAFSSDAFSVTGRGFDLNAFYQIKKFDIGAGYNFTAMVPSMVPEDHLHAFNISLAYHLTSSFYVQLQSGVSKRAFKVIESTDRYIRAEPTPYLAPCIAPEIGYQHSFRKSTSLLYHFSVGYNHIFPRDGALSLSFLKIGVGLTYIFGTNR